MLINKEADRTLSHLPLDVFQNAEWIHS